MVLLIALATIYGFGFAPPVAIQFMVLDPDSNLVTFGFDYASGPSLFDRIMSVW